MSTKKICNFDTVIIGGGAAGMFAGCISAENGRKIAVIEPNFILGKKLLITGKGRCNLTNNSDNETIMKNIPRNSKFMFSALSNFSSSDVMNYFEKLGVKLKTERGNRVFPVSDKASDIVDAMKNKLEALGVEIINDKAKQILTCGNSVTGVECEKHTINATKIILATGGMSYPNTGSTGDGYNMAKKFGHTITEIKPSLVPLNTLDDCSEMMGLSLRNVTATLIDTQKNKKLFSEMGEMLFTHFGVSGPLILSASSYIKKMESGRYVISVDLKPALTPEQLDKRILRDFEENKNKIYKNSLLELLPLKLIQTFIGRTEISPDKKVCEITKQERLKIIQLLKDFRVTIGGFRPIKEAIITDGGVSIKEIDPKTMQSKLINGLYFAGEIIDVTGFTGGFNLQIAFSTAYAAAIN